MICPDCSAASDMLGDTGNEIPAALREAYSALRPGPLSIEEFWRWVRLGHDRCFERNLGRPSPACPCQHRPVRVVSGG